MAATLCAPAIPAVVADVHASRAERTSNRQAGAAQWRTAVADNPAQVVYRIDRGFTEEARGAEAANVEERATHLEVALTVYERAQQLAPRNLLALLGMARTSTLFGQGVDPNRFAEADKLWHRAVRQDPQDWEVHRSYALMLNSWANALN